MEGYLIGLVLVCILGTAGQFFILTEESKPKTEDLVLDDSVQQMGLNVKHLGENMVQVTDD